MHLAEERGDVGADRAGQLAQLAVRIAAQQFDIRIETIQPQCAQATQQTPLHQLPLVFAQHDAAVLVDEVAQEREIAYRPATIPQRSPPRRANRPSCMRAAIAIRTPSRRRRRPFRPGGGATLGALPLRTAANTASASATTVSPAFAFDRWLMLVTPVELEEADLAARVHRPVRAWHARRPKLLPPAPRSAGSFRPSATRRC